MLVFDMHLKHGQLLFLSNLTYVSFLRASQAWSVVVFK